MCFTFIYMLIDSLILWNGDRNKSSIGQRFTTRELRRNESVVQCYLFSNHLVTTTRASSGKLHLVKGCGVIPLADVTLIEDVAADAQHLLTSVIEEDSAEDTNSNIIDSKTGDIDMNVNRLFRLIVESRDQTPYTTTFIANDEKHKSEWCTDIAQCLQNLRYTELVTGTFRNESSVISDLKLYKDDLEIKYSKTLDSCKIPQIRHATVERLLERLTDLRFLSIDFLNTFLLTYRLYTDAYTVMETLVHVYKSSPHTSLDHTNDIDGTNSHLNHKTDEHHKDKLVLINENEAELNRRVSEGDYCLINSNSLHVFLLSFTKVCIHYQLIILVNKNEI
uniref:N-terminal Ras-GEF domain-containing protein n=1 Tax=Adineta vaga TaxID=104782 RepID=B3G4L4_ADIVA|nr:unknown [Adineta vaga]